MAEICPRLQDPSFRFALLGSSGEALKRPIEKDWPETANYPYNDTRLSSHRGNVGAVGGYGDLLILDSDDLSRWEEMRVLDLIPSTLTVESRPGHRQFYLRCSEPIQSGGLFDPEQTDTNGYYIHVGDIKGTGGQAVAPGSRHPSGSTYQIVVDAPIAEVTPEHLRSIIKKFRLSKKSSRIEQNTAKLESMATAARQKKLETDPDRLRRYAASALEKEAQTLASTPEGSRNQQLNDSAFALGQLVAAGALDEGEVLMALSEAASTAGLPDGETRATIISGLEAGRLHPREIPAKEEPKAEPTTTDSTPCNLGELITTFKKWLYIKEDYNLTGPFSGVIANFCEGSPDIIGIIGPSGSSKTEIIRALGETANQYVYPVSTITQHTLVSGHKDSRDLVPQLKDRILAIKDLTSILSQKEDVRAAIFADFRELTDEYIRKEFGNGIAKEYGDVHSSIIFGSTNAIERYYSMYSNLGQRMIFLRPQNDPKEARKRASQNRGKQKEMRAELHAVTKRFIASMLQAKAENGLPTTPDDLQEEMGCLYDFLALARTTIHHDYKSGDIDELPEPEFPTRIANTIGRLMEVHALFYGREEVNAEDMAFGCRIISDNIPSMRWLVLRALTNEWQHSAKISQLSSLPSRSAKYHLDELVSLGLAEKLIKDEVENSMDHRFDYFKLSEIAAYALEKYDTRIRSECNIEEQLSKLLDKQNISLSNPCVISPSGEGGEEQSKKGEGNSPSPALGKIDREAPGLEKFKASMAKRECCLCGRSFPYDLTWHSNGDKSGYECTSCMMYGAPAKPDAQTKLADTQAT